MAELLKGRLGPVSLPGLLQLIDAEAIDGWLRVAPNGELGLRDGMVVAARWMGFESHEAFKLLFLVDDAEFVLDEGDAPQGDPMGTTTSMVFQALRFVDEWERLAARVLTTSPDYTPPDDAVRRVTDLLDGHLTVAEAVQLCDIAPSVVLDALTAGWSSGELAESSAPAPDRAALAQVEEMTFFELIDVGRTQLKAGEYARAEVAFLRALRQRPDDRMARQNLKRARQLRRAQQS